MKIQTRKPDGSLGAIVKGTRPFSIYGEKFAVTEQIGSTGVFIATHIEMGLRIPVVDNVDRAKVPDAAKSYCHAKGRNKFKRALSQAAKIIESAK